MPVCPRPPFSCRRKGNAEKVPEKKTRKTQNQKGLTSFFVHNLGYVAENGDKKEATGIKRQRGGAENSRIWLNLTLVSHFCLFCVGISSIWIFLTALVLIVPGLF